MPVATQPDHPPGEQLECQVRGGRDGRRGKPRIAQHLARERVLAAGQRRAAQDHLRVSAPGGREQGTQQAGLGLGSRGRSRRSMHKVHGSAGRAISADGVAGWVVA